MKKMLFGLAATAAMLLLSANNVQAQDFHQTIPTVSVNGSAQVKVTPDVIYLTINLDEGDTKGKDTLEEQRRRMFAALKKCGVSADAAEAVADCCVMTRWSICRVHSSASVERWPLRSMS